MIKKYSLFFLSVVLVIGLALVLWLLFFRNATQNVGEAFLTWNPSEEENIEGYRIYYGKTPRTDSCPKGGYTETVDVGKTIEYTLTGLENNTTYYFSVTSYNAGKKESCFSEEVSKNVKIRFVDRLKNIIN